MNSTDYLLTGASGFVGGVICAMLSSAYSVVTLGRSTDNIYRVDLAQDIPVLNRGFTTVIHVSGKAHSIPSTPSEAEEFLAVNYRGTVHLTKGLEASGKLPLHFVFISTVAVYGKESGELIDEEHPLLGSTPYAKSKIEAEKFLILWCAKNNVLLTILRLPLVVASNPPGNLGDMISIMKKGLYVGIGSGKASKSMVLAEDVAQFIPIVQSVGGIYNLTDGHHPTMTQLEHALAKLLKKRQPIRLPDRIVKFMARAGDLIGKKSPLNSLKYTKLISPLTFSDAKARAIGWNPRQVISNLPF